MEEKELVEAYGAEGDERARRRILMMLQLARGKSTTAVAREFLCSQSLVMYWKRRLEGEGVEGLRDKPRPGRPPKISLEVVGRVKERITEEGYVVKASIVRDTIVRESGVTYSVRQVQRLMHRWGFSLIRPRKKHYLAKNEEVKDFKKKFRASLRSTRTGS